MDETAEKTYHVTVGVAECTVTCQTERDAVEKARAELRRQLPHMGTIIQGINVREFRVDLVGS
ncbi:MAG: hypothetical protein JW809_11385 [Pirellulales bacterium]|nr:hypothetical protein [Pirellulales bacterium]